LRRFRRSISSVGPPYEQFAKLLPDNPHVRYFDSRGRGYVSVELTQERMTTRFRVLSDALDPQATVSTLRTFLVERGHPGAIPE
jgi:alkaline phosphatase D